MLKENFNELQIFLVVARERSFTKAAGKRGSVGSVGRGFIRLNRGCPRVYLEKAREGMKRIAFKSANNVHPISEFK